MNIIVIGGAGYIGSHVVHAMLESGHSVTVFDNLSSGVRENLVPHIPFIYGDILNYHVLVQSFRSAPFDAVIHLAALKAAGESMLQPEQYSVHNIGGSINILNAMAETGIKNIVFSSSASVYGEPIYVPMDEQHPCKPESYYGWTKLTIEQLMGWYEKLKGIRFAALRYFNAAGYDINGKVSGLEITPANLIPIIMEVAVGKRHEVCIFGDDYDTSDGTCIRDYVHVSDLARGHSDALAYIHGHACSIVCNLGSEKGTSVKEIIETARTVTGQDIPAHVTVRRPGDPAILTASAQKAHEILNWSAVNSTIERIIDSTWSVYKKNLWVCRKEV
ncbi:MAG: UDP-glucose 4-epimerase GalE [Treponema sp.]|jgi:UDP-glucose 4-epimerase|nr:UDP-glucose 4-epimerase GalE [Treponema sp.]